MRVKEARFYKSGQHIYYFCTFIGIMMGSSLDGFLKQISIICHKSLAANDILTVIQWMKQKRKKDNSPKVKRVTHRILVFLHLPQIFFSSLP